MYKPFTIYLMCRSTHYTHTFISRKEFIFLSITRCCYSLEITHEMKMVRKHFGPKQIINVKKVTVYNSL